MLSSLLILIAILALTSVGPGLFFVRPLQRPPIETLNLALGVSCFLFFLWAWVGALSGFLAAVVSLWVIIAVALTLAVKRDLARLLATTEVRKGLFGWLGLLSWALLLQAIAQHFGGADWSGDWYEHYQRAVFFTLWPFDPNFVFLRHGLLPERPPMMNVIVAGLMSLTNTSFPLFEIMMTFLNSLVYFPLLMLTHLFHARSPRTPWILTILLAVSPMFCQNVTYTWTKLFAAFWVLLAIGLYIQAWRLQKRWGFLLSFAAFSVGFLVHFSVGPYLFLVAGHYLLFVWKKRPRRLQELGLIVTIGTLILALWFSWSISVFGIGPTLSSNAMVADSKAQSPNENVIRILRNIERTVIPFVVIQSLPDDPQRVAQGVTFRDTVFLLYQNNVVFALGSLMWLVVLMLFFRERSQPVGDDEEPGLRFWLVMAVSVILLGIAVHMRPMPWGVAQICLQPLVLTILAFVATRLVELPAALKLLLLTGACVDLCAGIFLHFFLLHRDSGLGLGTVTAYNLQIKHRVGLTFLGDQLAPWGHFLLTAMVVAGLAMLISLSVTAFRPAASN